MGAPLMRVLFLNDVGFQYGAGTAHLRQIQSFLRSSHQVAALCCEQGVEEERAAFTPAPPPGWLGLREFRDLKEEPLAEAVVSRLVAAAREIAPDVVVVGNLHAARWPVSIASGLREAGMRVVVFMHDGYYVSGRCAYPGDCPLFETGCDETCPTADEYPVLEPSRIAGAWRERRQVLCGHDDIALAANSRWTLELARKALPGIARQEVVYYGLDERVFRPIDRALARRLLGVPPDRFVVAAGAVTLLDRRKGGPVLRQVVSALGREAHFLLFGHAPSDLEGVQALGYVRDFRRMPLVYSAADLFLCTSLEEAFGQTLIEASACGLPIVAFRAGGVPEAARHGVSARLVEPPHPDGLVDEIEHLRRDADARAALGLAGRRLVEAEFTLERQSERWARFLEAWPPQPAPRPSPERLPSAM